MARPAGKKRVVVLGTGWASAALSRGLDPQAYEVVVVSPRSQMVFTPLLASTATGTLEFRSVSEPIRYMSPHVRFQRGKAQTIDPSSKTVTVRAERPWTPSAASAAADQGVDLPDDSLELEIEYDALAISVGARNTTFGVNGVEEHALFLKELSDARAIRRTILRNFETASFLATSEEDRERLLSFVVVGGGPTGVEFAAELHDLIKEDLSWQFPDMAARASITLIERGDVLGAFDEGLRAYCRRRFARQGIGIIRAVVTDVRSGELTLEGGARKKFGMLVWSTGIAPRRLVSERLGPEFRRDGWGHIVVDEFLRAEVPGQVDEGAHTSNEPGVSASGSQGAAASAGSAPFPEAAAAVETRSEEVLPGVFALGDCAAVEGKRLAATAQVAEQQGTWLAKAMNQHPEWCVGTRGSDGPEKGFQFVNRGSLAYVGSWTSVSDFTGAGSEGKKVNEGLTIRGFSAWVVWRSAYLTKLGAWRNRMQVPSDWLRTFLFGRDTSLF